MNTITNQNYPIRINLPNSELHGKYIEAKQAVLKRLNTNGYEIIAFYVDNIYYFYYPGSGEIKLSFKEHLEKIKKSVQKIAPDTYRGAEIGSKLAGHKYALVGALIGGTIGLLKATSKDSSEEELSSETSGYYKQINNEIPVLIVKLDRPIVMPSR